MPKIKSLEDLERVRDEALLKRKMETSDGNVQVIVGIGTAGIAAGASATLKAIQEYVEQNQLDHIHVRQTGNIGFDSYQPIMQIIRSGEQKVTYGRVSPDLARRIIKEHVEDGKALVEHQVEV